MTDSVFVSDRVRRIPLPLLGPIFGVGLLLSPTGCESAATVDEARAEPTPVVASMHTSEAAPEPAPVAVVAPLELAEGDIVCAEDRCEVQRSFVRRLLAHPESVSGQIRLAPAKTGGFTVQEVKPGSLGERLALHNGDELVSVQGHRVASFDDLMAAYPQVEAADDIAVVLRRGGTLRTLHYIPVGE